MYFIDAEYETLPPICKLIYDGKISQAIKGAISGADLTKYDENGNNALHYAVMCNSEDFLDCLLNQCHVNVDLKNNDGETAFLMSLKMRRSSSFIDYFIIAGCDLNTQNDVQEIALHLAVSYNLNITVLHMLEKGADVNIKDTCNQTALHAAVECRNLEGGCMLLCFGADASITEHNNMTAFMFALQDYFEPMAEILFFYHSDFSDVSLFGDTPLLIAVKTQSNLAIDIVKAGANVNCLTRDGKSSLQYSLHYKNSELFHLIWVKVNHSTLKNTARSLLIDFCVNCSFSNNQWLECLYLVLESPHIYDLLNHVTLSEKGPAFLSLLLGCLLKRQIGLGCVTALIYTLLSLGITEETNFCKIFNHYLKC